jgi:hypothetical protein
MERYLAAFAAAARTAAQRFFVASMILCRPAALSFRFDFLATGLAVLATTLDSFFTAAHLFRWATAIRCLAAALIFRRLRVGSSVGTGTAVPPVKSCRSSAMWASRRIFCAWNPSIAAVRISSVNLAGNIPLDPQ